MNKIKCILLAVGIGSVFLQSCKDDEPNPRFKIETASVDESTYTGSGTLSLLYSTDGGETFTATLPEKLKKGTKVLVKVNNGTEDLSDDDFIFDWSTSSPAPTDETSGIAEFTIGSGNLKVNVELEEIMALLTNHRTTGKFYTIDPVTGDKEGSFTITSGGVDVLGIRGFLYHPKKKLYYATTSADEGGILYSIDPATSQATVIHENDGANDEETWYAVANWVVASDDSLVALSEFVDGAGIVKFGTDGSRSEKITRVDFCCGLGVTWHTNNSLLVANGWITGDGEVTLQNFALDGEGIDSQTLTNMEGFPVDISTEWLNMKALAKGKSGELYGILFTYDTRVSYFVKIDLGAEKINYISTLGEGNSNQYNTLVYIPKHLL